MGPGDYPIADGQPGSLTAGVIAHLRRVATLVFCEAMTGPPCVCEYGLCRWGTSPGDCSPASQRMNDLDPVALVQLFIGMRAARHDPAIDLYRHPAFAQAGVDQQLRHAAFRGQGMIGAVEQDFHAGIVAFRGLRCSSRQPGQPRPCWFA